jgi:hypothetical protein
MRPVYSRSHSLSLNYNRNYPISGILVQKNNKVSVMLRQKLLSTARMFHLFIKWFIRNKHSHCSCYDIDHCAYYWMTSKASICIEIGKDQPCNDTQKNTGPHKHTCKDKKLLKVTPHNQSPLLNEC